jgi:hypothetical protein
LSVRTSSFVHTRTFAVFFAIYVLPASRLLVYRKRSLRPTAKVS